MNKANRLAKETSPYLLQHAYNPVDWYPWCDEAFVKALQEDKPVLLSIGYSACHWCHVMAHESFVDDETAQVMNELFVNIKVDREERPDIDKVYQMAYQILNQRAGGWPLTVFLTPDDRIAFYAGTYFPVKAQQNQPTFKEILQYVADIYRHHKSKIAEQNQALLQTIAQLAPPAINGIQLDLNRLQKARDNLSMDYDRMHGGIAGIPKFPHPNNIELLLRYWWYSKEHIKNEDKFALAMAVNTLLKMGQGGIYDQLAGGFYRYSVNERWNIPHFEKMLYDNAQLLYQYSQAYLATRNEFFKEFALGVCEWILSEMQATQGGFYSTMDADSEGQEGHFYLWHKDQVQQLLDGSEYKIVAEHLGLNELANFEGRWHFYMTNTLAQVAQHHQLALAAVTNIWHSAREKLLKSRNERVHPEIDEKILTSWNGLAIKGLAQAGIVFQRGDLIAAAQKTVDFIREHVWINGRLLANYKDGQARTFAYLDDYVFLIEGLLILLQASWRDQDIKFLIDLTEVLLAHYYDSENGGFYFMADDHEQLFYRPKILMDESLPSGNGVAALILTRLGFLLGEQRYLDAAEKTLGQAWSYLLRWPEAHASLLFALQEFLMITEFIIIRGEPMEIKKWQQQAQQIYMPTRMVFAIPATVPNKQLPNNVALKEPKNNQTVAYICRGFSCQAAITDQEEFNRVIGQARIGS